MGKPITDVMRDYNRGKFVEETSEMLSDMVRSVIATGKKGKLVISIELKPTVSAAPAVQLKMEAADKSPEFDRPSEFMYVTPTNDLVRNHPDQGTLNLVEVGSLNLRRGDVVDVTTGEIITPDPKELVPPQSGQQQQRSA